MGDEFAVWQKEATADEATVRVCLNRAVYREFLDATAELEAYRPAQTPEGQQRTLDGPADVDDATLTAMVQRVVDAEQAVRDASRPLVFRQGPYREWRALVEKHPPQNGQADVDEDTFWPEAVARYCVEPGLTVEQARWLRDGDDDWPGLPFERWNEICDTVRQLHAQGSDVPKSVLSTVGPLRRALSSTMRLPGESPSRSFEGGA
jgi:hypothetical protein